MSTERTVAERDPIGKLLRDAEQYQPTPQEERWGSIEHKARVSLKRIEEGGVVGMTYETRCALDELAEAVGVAFNPETGYPLRR